MSDVPERGIPVTITMGGVATLLGYGPPSFPIVVSSGIFTSMLMAALLGTTLPLFFSRLGVDPAVASGPFVTTSVDIFGILSFCAVAAALL